MRELLRALHVNIPSLNYSDPTSYDTDAIPEHHRTDAKAEEGDSIYTKMNNWLWAAVDFIVPPVEDSGNRDPVIIIKVLEDKSSTSDANPPGSTTPNSPTTSQKSEVPPPPPPKPSDCGGNHKV